MEASLCLSYLRPKHTNDDGSQLLMLPPETSHVVETGLELPVRGAQAPNHF